MGFSSRCVIVLFLLVVAPTSMRGAEPQSRIEMMKAFTRPVSIPFPANNTFDAQKAHLGQMLFFDPRLSGSKWISCATCHNPGLSWGDGLPRGIGVGMKNLSRRTPTILNLAWSDIVMWDGRKAGLEDQVFGPMTSPLEMNGSIKDIVSKVNSIAAYQLAFKKAFGNEGVSARTIPLAVATYERTIVSGKAPFDRWIAGDETAIPDLAKRGFDVFNGKGHCAACHTGWSFTDNGFHDIGLADNDIGRGAFLKITSMQHAFKTPTLRDVDRRGPYMHDGSIETLAEVVDQYDRGGLARPSLAEEIVPLHLTDLEKHDLLAFLAVLTSEDTSVTVPELPRLSATAK